MTGSSDSVLAQATTYGYDEFNRLTSRTVTSGTVQNYTYVYDRYGNIVLDARERPVEEEQLRPSDIQAQERNTAPTCPQNVDPNAPCLSSIIGGHR